MATTHVLGPTLMPGWLMPSFYRSVAARHAGAGDVVFHGMSERGGLGRTDLIVDRFRLLLDQAAAQRKKVRLVGHSLGGIVAWVLAHDHPYAIESAELWCAPIRGTALANVAVPVAESRFLATASRWLRRYDRPLSGPRVRAVYTSLDALAVPPRHSCYLEGDTVENLLVAPSWRARRPLRANETLHRGTWDHVTLPRSRAVNAELAARDLA